MKPSLALDAPLDAVEVETPLGTFAAFVTPEDGVVRASGLGTALGVSHSLPLTLRERGWKERDVPEVRAAIRSWIAGDGGALNRVPVGQVGGAFAQRVWLKMRGIPRGEVVTYSELAVLVGNPGAARAVGNVCARNTIGLVVPCHRVVSASGLGGYGMGGNEVKRRLLEFEGVSVDRLRGG